MRDNETVQVHLACASEPLARIIQTFLENDIDLELYRLQCGRTDSLRRIASGGHALLLLDIQFETTHTLQRILKDCDTSGFTGDLFQHAGE